MIGRYITSNMWLSAYMLDISAYPAIVLGSKFIALFEHNFPISILPKHLHGINKVNQLHIFAAQRFQSSKTFIIPQITRNPCVVIYHISIMLLRKDCECFFQVKINDHIWRDALALQWSQMIQCFFILSILNISCDNCVPAITLLSSSPFFVITISIPSIS